MTLLQALRLHSLISFSQQNHCSLHSTEEKAIPALHFYIISGFFSHWDLSFLERVVLSDKCVSLL